MDAGGGLGVEGAWLDGSELGWGVGMVACFVVDGGRKGWLWCVVLTVEDLGMGAKNVQVNVQVNKRPAQAIFS